MNTNAVNARSGWKKRHADLAPLHQRQREAILARFARAAAEEKPCPGDTALGRATGVSTGNVTARVAELVAAGAITITRLSLQRRVVTITATGESTAPTSQEDDEPRQRPPAVRPPDRDPCFLCGVRGDIGCVHRPLELRA